MNRIVGIAVSIILLGAIFFYSPLFKGKVPVPLDALVGLYHPYRDFYKSEFDRGVPIKNSILGDPVVQMIPWKKLVVESFRNATLPLWNPYMMAGYPLLGNIQSSPFYPGNLFLLVFPFLTGWTLYIISQQVLAFGFMYAYLRNKKLDPIACLVGSMAFSFSGFFVAWLEWGNIIHTALWLPFILLCIDKVFVSKNRWWMVGLFGGIVSSYLAGHLQTFFYIASLTSLYTGLKFYLEKDIKLLIRCALPVFCAVLILLPIITVQLQFISLSARSVDLDWHNEGWFLPVQHLVQFVVPDYFGNPTTQNYWGVWNYGEFVGYIGILPFVFALFAVFFRRDKKTYFFATIVGIAILLMLPTIFGKLPFKLGIPFLSTTQPTRLMILVDFSLAVLAALGVDRFIKNPKKFYLPLLTVAGFILCAFFIGLNLVGTPFFTPESWAITQRNLMLPTLLLGCAFGVYVLYTYKFLNREFNKQILLLLIVLFTVGDLLYFVRKYTPFTESRFYYPNTKIISFLSEKSETEQFRILKTDKRILHPNIAAFYHIQSIDGYDPLYLRTYGELMAAMGRRKPDTSTPWGFSRIITPDQFDTKINDLLGVKYVLSFRDQTEPYLKKVLQEGEIYVFENLKAYPRAFFVGKVEERENKQAVLESMFEPGSNMKEISFVEKTPDLEDNKAYDQFGIAKINSYKAEQVILNTKTTSEGFLVLTDSFYPTWRVKIDGKNTKIYKTNYHFRGVVVPQGEHTVEFYNSFF